VKSGAVVLAVISFIGVAATELRVDGTPPLQVVPWVDFGRYAGQWYEIAIVGEIRGIRPMTGALQPNLQDARGDQ
jgi:lipocalin